MLRALQRCRQSEQQEGGEAIGVSETSDQRCNAWGRGYLYLLNVQNRLAGPCVFSLVLRALLTMGYWEQRSKS